MDARVHAHISVNMDPRRVHLHHAHFFEDMAHNSTRISQISKISQVILYEPLRAG